MWYATLGFLRKECWISWYVKQELRGKMRHANLRKERWISYVKQELREKMWHAIHAKCEHVRMVRKVTLR